MKRVLALAAIIAVPFVGAAPASAGVVDCTVGYPATLGGNPYNPLGVTVQPQVSARGPVDYANYVVNATFGYVNCVL